MDSNVSQILQDVGLIAKLEAVSGQVDELSTKLLISELQRIGLEPLRRESGAALLFLFQHGTGRMREIAAGVGQSVVSMNWAVQELIYRGLAVWQTNGDISLTTRGRDCAKAVVQARSAVLSRIFSGISESDLSCFLKMLDSLEGRLSAAECSV